ncbi:MAG: 5-oxoprolinase subunit PxpB, partial [Kangiellaceae bacterium]
DFKIRPNGDSAITILFANEISKTLTEDILLLKNSISTKLPYEQLLDIVPAYQSLTLYFANPMKNFENIKKDISTIVNQVLSSEFKKKNKSNKQIQIPVCYEDEFAPDLKKLSLHLKIEPSELIKKHTSGTYLVHMLGFLPGFLYLGGLDKSLHFPRKRTPAIKITKGSVGIGGSQTGIYPIDSPGGWHIIGRTPVTMFDLNRDEITIANPLDEIKFYSITSEEFRQFETEC